MVLLPALILGACAVNGAHALDIPEAKWSGTAASYRGSTGSVEFGKASALTVEGGGMRSYHLGTGVAQGLALLHAAEKNIQEVQSAGKSLNKADREALFWSVVNDRSLDLDHIQANHFSAKRQPDLMVGASGGTWFGFSMAYSSSFYKRMGAYVDPEHNAENLTNELLVSVGPEETILRMTDAKYNPDAPLIGSFPASGYFDGGGSFSDYPKNFFRFFFESPRIRRRLRRVSETVLSEHTVPHFLTYNGPLRELGYVLCAV